MIVPKDANERTGIISAEARHQIYVDAMNRNPNVVTMGVGERVVKPATEKTLWAGFFCDVARTNDERTTMNLKYSIALPHRFFHRLVSILERQ